MANIEVCSQDDLSNDIETLLEEVKIVQANLSDLPDESLDAMEQGLRVSHINIVNNALIPFAVIKNNSFVV